MLTPIAHERTRHLLQRIDELEKTVVAYREAIEDFGEHRDAELLLNILEVVAW